MKQNITTSARVLRRNLAQTTKRPINFAPVTSTTFSRTSIPSASSIPTSRQFTTSSHALSKASSETPAPGAIFVNLQFETLTEMFEKTCKHHANNKALGTRNGSAFEWITFAELWQKVEKTRTILAELGINKEDKVAIISNNRTEWAIFNYAILQRNSAIVPMYEAQLEKDWEYIINDSDSKVVVVANEKIYEKVKEYINKIGKVQHVICLDAPEDKPYSYKYWLKKVESSPAAPILPVTSEDICSIIYTSGTTGRPKGVELVHRNIVSNIITGKELVKDYIHNQTSLAFLPWAHIYGQSTELHSMISAGCAIAIVPNREQILECISIVKPTLMFSVPILFNKVYDGVNAAMKAQSPVVQFLYRLALRTARERNHRLEFNQPVGAFLNWRWKVLDKIVLKKVRERLGGNLQRMGAGGAATSLPVLQFFEDIGIPVIEGYGLTETAPIITAGSVDFSNRRLGCVGVPLPGQDVRIIDPNTNEVLGNDTDGEIVASGPNVMKGYRNNPKANEEVFLQIDNKRFFRTGDLGRLVEGKYLKITGRIKEQFKLENGKFVVPAPLEDIFSRGPMILQSFLYGDNKKYTILLIVPNFIEIENWAKAKHPDLLPFLPKDVKNVADLGKNDEENTKLLKLYQSDAFIKKVSYEIVRHSKHAKSYERPLKWYPLLSAFTQENQMMTPKMSLRRKNVIDAYQKILDGLYQGEVGNTIEYPPSDKEKK